MLEASLKQCPAMPSQIRMSESDSEAHLAGVFFKRWRKDPKYVATKGTSRLSRLVLIQDLYAAHKDNRTFLHTRFGLSEDVLKPYKQTGLPRSSL